MIKQSRFALGAISVVTILTGQFFTAGGVYGESFIGLSGGILRAITGLLHPSGNGAALFMLFGTLLVIGLMIALYASLVIALVITVYVAIRRDSLNNASRLASGIFAGLAIFTLIGLASSRWLAAHSADYGKSHVVPYFFLWPICFIILAVLYATLFRIRENS